MTTSSEDVLLQVPDVKYKKGDGTLFLMDSRLAWMVENKDTVAVSHSYADIKTQKISPDGKSKVQLQVVLHSGVTSTFHFTHKDGVKAQAADRDRVKELLQSLLPKFKLKVDRELEEKNKLLTTNPSLLQLYKDLVITEVVTSEEFWTHHASEYTTAKSSQAQEIGVSGAFLADIKPQTDGCNGLKYNITADIIECIFKTYPAVKKKFVEHVPSKMNESQFWTKFFQSHYFHRDRKYAESKDVFTDCGKIDDLELKRDIQNGVDDPLVSITSFDDKTVDEAYGTQAERSAAVGTVSQAMIKRFNQHSIMVLKASSSRMQQQSINGHGGDEKKTRVHCQNGDADEAVAGCKKRRILEKLVYDDLENRDDSNAHVATQLNLSKVERYLHGPVPGAASEQLTPNEVASISRNVHQELKQWRSRMPTASLVTSAAAVSALGELSPGGVLMIGFKEHSLAQMVPSEIENEVRNLYLSLSELLSHFWKSFPAANPIAEHKLIKMHEALHRYQAARLKPFEEKLSRVVFSVPQHLTKHLNQQLNAAYQKFSQWQEMRMKR